MSVKNLFPVIKPVGINGMLVQFSDKLEEASNRAAISFCDAIRKQNWSCVEELSATLVSTYLRFDTQKVSHEELTEELHVKQISAKGIVRSSYCILSTAAFKTHLLAKPYNFRLLPLHRGQGPRGQPCPCAGFQ